MLRRTLFALPLLIPWVPIAPANAGDPTPGLRVLFIGNSYTYQSWDALLATFRGHHIEKIAKGGAKLADWAQDPEVYARVRAGRWDYVVLQDQSQSPALGPESVAAFRTAVRRLDRVARGVGAKTLLFMTWGRRDGDSMHPDTLGTFESMQSRLTAAYTEAAAAVGAGVVPVGEVFRAIRARDPEVFRTLYHRDGSHPEGPGTLAVAYTFYASIVGKSPRTADASASNRKVVEAVEGVVLGKALTAGPR